MIVVSRRLAFVAHAQRIRLRATRSMVHVVDEGNAITLIPEGRVGERRPAAVLALVFIGRPARYSRRRKSYPERAASNRHSGGYSISGRADL